MLIDGLVIGRLLCAKNHPVSDRTEVRSISFGRNRSNNQDMSEAQRCKADTGLPLPDDLHYQIFELLDFRSLLKCQKVCKAWNQLLKAPRRPNVWGAVCLRTPAAAQFSTVQTAAAYLDGHSAIIR